MKLLEKIASKLCVLGAIAGGIAMFMMMVQVGVDVTTKYLFNMPVRHTLEMVSSYYMVALVFLPLGLVTRDNGHVVVELFTHGFSKRTLALINALAGILTFAYVSAMTVRSFEVAVQKTAIRESWEAATLDLQVWPARWFLPIGCALMALYLVVQVIRNLQEFRKRQGPGDHTDAAGL